MPNNLRQNTEIPKLIGYLVAPSALSADNTPAALDIRGYTNVRVFVGWGAGGITFNSTDKIEIKLRDGDSTVGNHVAVDAADVVMPSGESLAATGIVKSFTAAATASGKFVDYVGDQEYLSCLADFAGTHGAATPLLVAVYGLKGRLNPPL